MVCFMLVSRRWMAWLLCLLTIWAAACAATTPSSPVATPPRTSTPGPASPIPRPTGSPSVSPCVPPPAEPPRESRFPPLDGAGMIAYSNDGLWLVHPDTGQNVRLHAGLDGAFAWAPDGRRIAFLSYLRLSPCAFAFLMLADLEAGLVRPLLDRPGLYSRPAWSPDGQHLAYTDADGYLYVLRPGDGSPRTLRKDAYVARAIDLHGRPVDRFPTSPKWIDGQRIAYLKQGPSGNVGGIEVVFIDRVEAQMRVDGTIWPYDGFAPTPDGRQLIYAHGEEGPLVMVDLVAGERTIIMEHASSPARIPYEDLQWSPDGLRLIGKTGMAGIVLVERDGTAYRISELGALGVPGEAQSWAPDGRRFILIQSEGPSLERLIIYDLTTHQRYPLAVTTRPPYGAAWNPKGTSR